MEIINDINKAIETISSSSGKKPEEIKEMIETKKGKFSGLLTDSGATFIIAKELGVELDKQKPQENTKIAELKDGMNNVDIIARLKACFTPRQFDKNGRKGVLQNITLQDGKKEIRATLWHKDVEKFAEMKVNNGECLKLSNCSVSSYNNNLQLNLNYNSTFAKEENSEIPKLEQSITEISDLDTSMSDVTVIVKIKKTFPSKNFETERGKGKVMNFIISEGLEETRATAWNDTVDAVEEFSEGDKVKIEGAYTKEGMNGIELHLGWSARIIKEE